MNKELEDALGNLTQQAYNSVNNEKQLQKDKEHYEFIKKYLDALEIIINKNVRIRLLQFFDELQTYNCVVMYDYVPDMLSQEEFDLLKEVLCNESLQ